MFINVPPPPKTTLIPCCAMLLACSFSYIGLLLRSGSIRIRILMWFEKRRVSALLRKRIDVFQSSNLVTVFGRRLSVRLTYLTCRNVAAGGELLLQRGTFIFVIRSFPHHRSNHFARENASIFGDLNGLFVSRHVRQGSFEASRRRRNRLRVDNAAPMYRPSSRQRANFRPRRSIETLRHVFLQEGSEGRDEAV